MAEFGRNDWENALRKAAVRAVDARIEHGKMIGEKHRQDQSDVWYKEYLAKIKSEMPFENVTENDLERLERFKSENMFQWLDKNFKGPSPKDVEKNEEAEKFMPILHGVAKEGDSWYDMATPRLKGIAAQLGYDPSTQEGFKMFLDKVGEYQRQHDLAQNTKEMMNSPYFLPSMIAYPTATQEILNAVATGEGGDKETVTNLAAMDALANGAMMMAPNLNLIKANPILNSVLNAGFQAGIEGGRQAYAQSESKTGQEFSADPLVYAFSAGSTIPGSVNAARMITSRMEGPQAQAFSRGIMRATRAGNPAWRERANIESTVNQYNKLVKDGTLGANKDGVARRVLVDLGEGSRLMETNKVPAMAKFYGVKPNADGTYSAKDVLKAYDKKPMQVLEIGENGVTVPNNPTANVKASEVLITPENSGEYSKLFGAKFADESSARNGWSNLGMVVGKGAGDLGASLEPTFKVQPQSLLSGDVDKSLENLKPDYKNQAWYKKLSPESKKIVDEKFKKQQGE